MIGKAISVAAVFISLIMAAPLSAEDLGDGKNGRNRDPLTDPEIEHITYMREEEKLARDVYQQLYAKYKTSVFRNIGRSEQRHMDALKRLISKHGLDDPVKDNTRGVFTNPVFTALYKALVKKGEESYCSALQVGVEIEELDIEDIKDALKDAKAVDVRRVFRKLLSGSYNHLRAFTNCQRINNCP